MPELPEVQTIVSDLKYKVIGRRIIDFWTDWPKSICETTPKLLKKEIKGLKILDVKRLGKHILIKLDKDRTLLIHQKMTGHLMVGRWSINRARTGWSVEPSYKGSMQDRVNRYIHAVFTLDNDTMLALSDMRKFARICFGPTKNILTLPAVRGLGPDALDKRLSVRSLGDVIRSRNASIKQVLMNPAVIAGIGNIYADEILWGAGIHPARPARTLRSAEIERILVHTRKVLNRALRLRGTSVGDYRDTAGQPGGYGRELRVYQRTGEPCLRCGTPIKRIKLGQRSAHFCPHCQKR